MARILIIEDEPAMQLGLKDNLEFENYQVDVANEGETGLQKIKSGQHDLVLLDVMLPRLSGFDICKAARAAGIKTPIILLTARGEEIDKVLGLELGANDYMTKPFEPRELLARIHVQLRSSAAAPVTTSTEQLRYAGVELDVSRHQARYENRDVELTKMEFALLFALPWKKMASLTAFPPVSVASVTCRRTR